ncbi:hypothetical protein H8959_018675, partial [Pygathrix nigripes]
PVPLSGSYGDHRSHAPDGKRGREGGMAGRRPSQEPLACNECMALLARASGQTWGLHPIHGVQRQVHQQDPVCAQLGRPGATHPHGTRPDPRLRPAIRRGKTEGQEGEVCAEWCLLGLGRGSGGLSWTLS